MEEEKIKSEDIIEVTPLDNQSQQIISTIVKEEDPDKIKQLTNLFNLNQTKRNILRANTYNELLDSIANQMAKRIKTRSDEFSNADLKSWLQIVQDNLDKKENYSIDTAPIISQINQINQVNIDNGTNSLSRESREKILDLISNICKKLDKEDVNSEEIDSSENNPIEAEVVETSTSTETEKEEGIPPYIEPEKDINIENSDKDN